MVIFLYNLYIFVWTQHSQLAYKVLDIRQCKAGSQKFCIKKKMYNIELNPNKKCIDYIEKWP